MREQFHAGYILSGIRDALLTGADAPYWRGVLRNLSSFDLELDSPPAAPVEPDSIAAVADNIISRGMPTLAPLLVERRLAEDVGLTVERMSLGSIRFPLRQSLGDGDAGLLSLALAPVDPRISSSMPYAGIDDAPIDPGAELPFFTRVLPKVAGEAVRQVAEPQRFITSILPTGDAHEFAQQQVDFAIELPEADGYRRGLIIEVDGREYHEQEAQKHLDKKRDRAVERSGWGGTVRIVPREMYHLPEAKVREITSFLQHPYARALTEAYKAPLWNTAAGRRWLQAALAPFAVARIEKTLTTLVLRGYLSLSAPVWRIAALERDVPCARLALADFEEMIGNLLELEGRGRRMPRVELRVLRTREFKGFEAGQGDEASLVEKAGAFKADVLLDVSVLQRPGFSRADSALLSRMG